MRPRFNLKSLFIFTTALTLVLWILLKPSIDQKLAHNELLQAEARLSYGETPRWVPRSLIRLLGQDLFVPVENVRVNWQLLKRQDLEMISKLPHLMSVTLDKCEVSQAVVNRLAALKRLSYIHFEDSNLDASLSFEPLRVHPQLRYLSFRNSVVPQELVGHLRACNARVIVDENRLNYGK